MPVSATAIVSVGRERSTNKPELPVVVWAVAADSSPAQAMTAANRSTATHRRAAPVTAATGTDGREQSRLIGVHEEGMRRMPVRLSAQPTTSVSGTPRLRPAVRSRQPFASGARAPQRRSDWAGKGPPNRQFEFGADWRKSRRWPDRPEACTPGRPFRARRRSTGARSTNHQDQAGS